MHTLQLKQVGLCIAVFIIGFNAHAQTDCSTKKVVGKWKEIASIPGIIANLDSAKDGAIDTKRNIGTWEFFGDLSYEYKHALHRSRYKPKGTYLVDEQTCEIIIASKKYKREDSNLEILHVDDRYLLYKSNNNPKGYFTHLLRKVE